MALVAGGLVGCGGEAPDAEVEVERSGGGQNAAGARGTPSDAAATVGSSDDGLTPQDIERRRLDGSWRVALDGSAPERDGAGPSPRPAPSTDTAAGDEETPEGRSPDEGPEAEGDTARSVDRWDEISADRVNGAPLAGSRDEAAGPSVLRLQILLDRALFSPGILDGRWGKNTEKALAWLQSREGLEPTGEVNGRTERRLEELAGSGEAVRTRTLTEEDVSGPFVDVPDDPQAQADLDCMCYESRAEKLAERFHTSEDVLRRLNPGVELSGLGAGETLRVPNVRDRREDAGRGVDVARLRISDGGHFVHALDAEGRILFHFPSTLGSAYDPSPTGEYRIESITEEPWWHYQPELLDDVPDDRPDARIPPGPNNAVGLVWMALSEPHYGIHGTSAPETIGYVTSAGCVRLTNWDALFLADRVEEGTEVVFTDTRPEPGGQ